MKSIIMDLYLKKLYNLEYDPFNDLSKSNLSYTKKQDKLNSLKDTFYENLNRDAKNQYDDIFVLQYELEDIVSAYTFSESFKMAYEISLEVFHQYQK